MHWGLRENPGKVSRNTEFDDSYPVRQKNKLDQINYEHPRFYFDKHKQAEQC